MQFWCGLGYNVVLVNARGSTGYGLAYEEALVGRWGPPMERDATAVVAAVSKRPDVHPNRLAATGGSYGGDAGCGSFRTPIALKPRSPSAASDIATQSMTWYEASPNGLGGNYAWGRPWDPKNNNAKTRRSRTSTRAYPGTPAPLDARYRNPADQTLDEFSALKQLGERRSSWRFRTRITTGPDRQPIHRVERLHLLADWFGRWLSP